MHGGSRCFCWGWGDVRIVHERLGSGSDVRMLIMLIITGQVS